MRRLPGEIFIGVLSRGGSLVVRLHIDREKTAGNNLYIFVGDIIKYALLNSMLNISCSVKVLCIDSCGVRCPITKGRLFVDFKVRV